MHRGTKKSCWKSFQNKWTVSERGGDRWKKSKVYQIILLLPVEIYLMDLKDKIHLKLAWV